MPTLAVRARFIIERRFTELRTRFSNVLIVDKLAMPKSAAEALANDEVTDNSRRWAPTPPAPKSVVDELVENERSSIAATENHSSAVPSVVRPSTTLQRCRVSLFSLDQRNIRAPFGCPNFS